MSLTSEKGRTILNEWTNLEPLQLIDQLTEIERIILVKRIKKQMDRYCESIGHGADHHVLFTEPKREEENLNCLRKFFSWKNKKLILDIVTCMGKHHRPLLKETEPSTMNLTPCKSPFDAKSRKRDISSKTVSSVEKLSSVQTNTVNILKRDRPLSHSQTKPTSHHDHNTAQWNMNPLLLPQSLGSSVNIPNAREHPLKSQHAHTKSSAVNTSHGIQRQYTHPPNTPNEFVFTKSSIVRDSVWVQQLQGMGFIDMEEICQGIQNVKKTLSTSTMSDDAVVEAVMFLLVSKREEVEESIKRGRKSIPQEGPIILLQHFPDSWLLKVGQIKDSFQHHVSIVKQIETNSTKADVLKLLEMEKNVQKWYGTHVPQHYFHILSNRIAAYYSSTKNSGVGSITLMLRKEIQHLEEAVYSLKDQVEGGLGFLVPKVFIDDSQKKHSGQSACVIDLSRSD